MATMCARTYEPKDSNDAGDLFRDGMEGAVDAALRLVFSPLEVDSGYRWARLGMLQRILELGFEAPKVAIYHADHDGKRLLTDADWLDVWPEPEKVKCALVAMGEVFARMRKEKAFALRGETLLPPRVLVAIRPGKGKD
jgi:hypothetical protein